jgi:hypothetical protein
MGSGRTAQHQYHGVAVTLTPSLAGGPPDQNEGSDPAAGQEIPRIVLTPVASGSVTGIGYDRGRLEVAFADGSREAFRDVPLAVWERLSLAGSAVSQGLASEVRDNPGYRYDSSDQADAAGWVRRCPECGQFADDTHLCPARAPARSYLSDNVSLTAPDPAAVRDFLAEHGWATVPVHGQVRDPVTGEHQLDGSVLLHQDESGLQVVQGPRCDCGHDLAGPADSCGHSALAAAELVGRLGSPRTRAPERQAAEAVLDGIGVDHATSVRAQAGALTSWADSAADVSYAADPAAFQAAYAAARDRRARGETPVPYLTENATGGLGARNGGRGFGVELEFDLPGMGYSQQREALGRIATELRAAGLSRHAGMVGYHGGRSNGGDSYSDAPDGWRLEQDGTVAGEVVSPILYDEPRTWQALNTVCATIRRHGGVASVRTGGHVHVSTANSDHTVETHNRLLSMVAAHEDTLFRLAQNPAASRHRGTAWCAPNRVHNEGYQSVDWARASHSGHHLAVNLQWVYGSDRDHVEFRMWDGSLDPGVVQTQIKVSLGLTEAAFRTAREAPPRGGAREPLGTHRRNRPGRGRLRGEQWQADTASFRDLVDSLFRRAQDKAQAAALFAVTRWQPT